MVRYDVTDINPDMSFLEMLDVLNDHIAREGEIPIEFDGDCREGICGTCGMVINGIAHGHKHATTTCELHMREFKDGQTITVEPFRARAFPVIKDLVISKGALDRIMTKSGYISVNTGSAPEANSILVPREISENAMDSAACIQCGACVAACPNASAVLFVGARLTQLALLPQGHPERETRVRRMVEQMDAEGFGNCSNHAECEAVCPKKISIANIAKLRREFWRTML
jgi:succinate dehydrogenase / fumarate reductase iron-sulfur subunit